MTDRVVNVRDDAEHNRFLVDLDGDPAQLVYDTEPGRLILVHTEVPDAHQGRGVGGQLVEAALQRARQENLTLVPWCPFARRWLRGHRDDDVDLLIDWTSPPATAGRRLGAATGEDTKCLTSTTATARSKKG